MPGLILSSGDFDISSCYSAGSSHVSKVFLGTRPWHSEICPESEQICPTGGKMLSQRIWPLKLNCNKRGRDLKFNSVAGFNVLNWKNVSKISWSCFTCACGKGPIERTGRSIPHSHRSACRHSTRAGAAWITSVWIPNRLTGDDQGLNLAQVLLRVAPTVSFLPLRSFFPLPPLLWNPRRSCVCLLARSSFLFVSNYEILAESSRLFHLQGCWFILQFLVWLDAAAGPARVHTGVCQCCVLSLSLSSTKSCTN